MKHYKRWIIAGAALTAAVVLLLCVAGVFRVREVTVTGNEYYTKEQIADFVIGDGLKRNTLYLYVRYNYMEHPEIPFIDAFEVKVDSPSSLTIRVYEKNIVGYVHYLGKNVYFDKDGIVLAKTKELWDGIPCIEGLEVKKVQLYKELPVSKANKKAFGNLLDMTMTLKKCDLAPDKIVCSGSDLYLFFGNKCVNVGHTNLEERIMQISPILEKLGDQGGTLYLENFNTDNITITFEKDVIPDLGT